MICIIVIIIIIIIIITIVILMCLLCCYVSSRAPPGRQAMPGDSPTVSLIVDRGSPNRESLRDA